MHGTPIYVWENGKVVAKDPRSEGEWKNHPNSGNCGFRGDIPPRGSVADCGTIPGRIYLLSNGVCMRYQ